MVPKKLAFPQEFGRSKRLKLGDSQRRKTSPEEISHSSIVLGAPQLKLPADYNSIKKEFFDLRLGSFPYAESDDQWEKL